ncbi:salicylate synthase [Micromonospora olivasterospora]|uniref:Salicylate synthetase/mycobactin phenyloxazoline synthetase n=1 Tax=Micromonospora olivasterospora TaxID=1880 RepID=A0A562I3I5_MICOL|nr:salicylate synthase [Micromonospora olivasterospora]TWH65183.1 salicylate synthetase/mycobactin phenyloxazoline synthetase [Micromonospora olivasterospora]
MDRPGLLEDDRKLSSPYYSGRMVGAGDPLRLATELARATSGPYVLYENNGTWSLASGSAYELVLYADTLRVRDADGWSVRAVGADPLQTVADALSRCPIGGAQAYGWAGFGLGQLLHGDSAAARGPLLHLMVPAREVRISLDAIDVRTVDAADLLLLTSAVDAATRAVPCGATPLPPPDPDHDADFYRKAVASAVEEIRARRYQKVILSRLVPVDGDVDLVATYEAGRRANTPARSYLLDLGGLRCAGFSPETVVEVTAAGSVSTQPLAGTRARHGDPLLDTALRAELQADAKEVFEHAISVKLAFDELTSLAVPGTVQVDDFMDVKERGSVQHLASRLSATLNSGRNAWHALAVLFPAITASGVPKAAACEAIERLENAPRGLYSGAVLTIDADGSMDAALVLRSVFQQEGRTWLRAGAGIIEQSTPERELEETAEKLRSISRHLHR